MDDKLKEAQEVLAELNQDYGVVPSVKVQNVLDLIENGYSQDAIEEFYRSFIRTFEDEAYKNLNRLRNDFGRCRLVKEHTVLRWAKAFDTEDEMKAKYRRAVRREERAERIDIQIKRRANDLGINANHAMDDILNVLESYSQESDAQIAERVTTAVLSISEMT